MIRLFAMDVDGTLTDGGIYMDGEREFKRFDVKDGQGIAELLNSGVRIAFISGRSSEPTQQRADNLHISCCINGTRDKLIELRRLCEEWHISQSEVAFAGDDTPDIECIKWAGLGIAVSDAHPLTAAAADFVTKAPGGRGAIRESAEYILKINNGE